MSSRLTTHRSNTPLLQFKFYGHLDFRVDRGFNRHGRNNAGSLAFKLADSPAKEDLPLQGRGVDSHERIGKNGIGNSRWAQRSDFGLLQFWVGPSRHDPHRVPSSLLGDR